jgi:hypothetical protein
VLVFLFEKACREGMQQGTLTQTVSRIRRALGTLCARTYLPTRRNCGDGTGDDDAAAADAIARDAIAAAGGAVFRGKKCDAKVAVAPAVAQAVREVAGSDALDAAMHDQAAGICEVVTHVVNPCFTRMATRVWRDAEEARKGERLDWGGRDTVGVAQSASDALKWI